MRPVNINELKRLVKEYEHCAQEVRVYKSHILALQEDLEEVEKENNTLRLITEKSEQSRRMSILITENESLFQYNNTLSQQLEDLEDDIIQNGRNFQLEESSLIMRHLQQGEGGLLFLCQDHLCCFDLITSVTNFL